VVELWALRAGNDGVEQNAGGNGRHQRQHARRGADDKYGHEVAPGVEEPEPQQIPPGKWALGEGPVEDHRARREPARQLRSYGLRPAARWLIHRVAAAAAEKHCRGGEAIVRVRQEEAKQRAVVVLPPGSGQGDLAVLDGRSTTEHADIPKRIIRGREILRRPDLEAEMPPECAASGENSRSAF